MILPNQKSSFSENQSFPSLSLLLPPASSLRQWIGSHGLIFVSRQDPPFTSSSSTQSLYDHCHRHRHRHRHRRCHHHDHYH